MIPVAILAGGLATRLGPITATTPKSLVEVAGEPFISHQLRLLRREKVESVVLCVGHLGEAICAFVGDGRAFGLDVRYSFEGKRLLGTGGALRRALPLLGDAFMVFYGDSYLDIAFAPVLQAFRIGRRPALMTVFRNEGRWDTSNVIFNGSRVLRHDKRARSPNMQYIDYGLGILKSGVLASRAVGEVFDLSEVYGALAAAGQLAGYKVEQRFYEIGNPSGLAETDTFLRQRG
jgi:NDP-sugar pyrophosphorylase family protein